MWFQKIKQLKLKNPLNVNIAYININTIENKFDRLIGTIENNIDILCISETKLDSSYPINQFVIPGYNTPYRLDGPKLKSPSGGLLLFIKEHIPSKILKTRYKLPENLQAIPIELNLRKSKWLVVAVYRPETFKKTDFICALNNLSDIYSDTYDNILLLGDFNMESTDTDMLPLIESHDLYSMIKTPTCFKSTQGRCIDLMLTNKRHNFMHTQTFETGESDFHYMIYTMFKTKFEKAPAKVIKYRCFKKFKNDIFQCDLSNNLYNTTTGIFTTFEETFRQTLDKHAPYKTKFVRGNNKPFINKKLRNAIATRSRLRNIAKKTNKPADILNYKRHRNYVKNMNFKIKRDYYQTLNPKKLEMNKRFWKTFKPFLSGKNESIGKLLLVENEDIINDDSNIAETMNMYFGNITKGLEVRYWPELEEDINDAVSKAIRKHRDHPSIKKIQDHGFLPNDFKFKHILPADVKAKISQLNSAKSTRGEIPINILKENVDIYCVYLADCFNTCINDGIFPDVMKLADITQIFKKDDKTNKKNYRPISILSALSKVFERILCDQINEFMDGKLSNLLCGFRKGYNTECALLYLLENWRKQLDNGQIIGAVLCDLSKAFDTLPHDLIIAKLAAYGLGDNALKLISDYLKGRFQRVKVGSSFSNWIEILLGVPQGSVLGPILFNIFINDYIFFIIDCGVCNFVDDQTLYSHGQTIDIVVSKLEGDIKRTLTWCEQNSLVPNPDKFQIMFLGTKTFTNMNLKINGQTTSTTKTVQLLGITIDWKLQFNKHVKELCKSANKRAGALMRLRNKLNVDQKILLYNSFIKSQFSYCPLIWMFHGKSTNNKVNRIQKRALMAVYNDFHSTFDQLLSKGNHSPIHELNLKFLITKVFQCVNKESPPLLNGFFDTKDNCHNLRIRNLLQLPINCSTQTYGIHSFSYRGSATWNSLPDNIKESASSSVLKSKLQSTKIKCSCKLCISS